MEIIRAAIIDRRETAQDDDEFIRQLNTLIKDHGDSVCTVIFSTLANIDLPLKIAAKYWQDVQSHRLYLIRQLNRNVTLTTAISDYLHAFTKFLPNSCLVDAGTFERVISGTIHDNLTGLYNRPYFDEAYEQQISLAKRYNSDLSVLFLDIDDFKDINDHLGHIAGDFALQEVAEVIMKCKRESDIASRFGGEEFVLLMPNTATVDASILAERIREQVERSTVTFRGTPIKLTISGGLASYPLNSTNPKDLLFMADSAVYLAKGSGKNTISHFKEEQRRYLRVKMQRSVLIKGMGFENDHVSSAMSRDIGMGGILLENATALALGSLQEMSIAVSDIDNHQLLLIGKVVRIEECGERCFYIGLCFSFKEMAKEASNQIAGFLKEYIPPARHSPQHRAMAH